MFLSEPGRGHADAQTSVGAVEHWGVQEREIIAATLADECTRAGFTRVILKPLAHIVPWYEMDVDRWGRWQQYAAARRPRRAAARALRAIAEVFGLGKQTMAFEDTLGMELVRIVKDAMDHHPIVVASKT